MQEKILVVDDEKEIADLIDVYLQNENMKVYKFYTGKPALKCAMDEKFDLAILDIMLPDASGLDMCRQLRDAGCTYPILILTAKNDETDKITGLTLGADDYITKPFRPLELVARVKAQLRRYKKYNSSPVKSDIENRFVYSGIDMNLKTHECQLNGVPLSLTPTEFSILKILLEHKGEIVSSEELFREIWKDEYYSRDSNSISVHIRHLREKLGDSADNPKYIKTVWGVGYKIEKR